MQAIQSVLHRMTPNKYADLALQAEREGKANLRLAHNEAVEAARRQARQAWEREQILQLDRPEYRSLRHATWKDKLYRRAIKREEWEAFQFRKLLERYEESEQKKDEWQEFNPEDVVLDLSNLPKF